MNKIYKYYTERSTTIRASHAFWMVAAIGNWGFWPNWVDFIALPLQFTLLVILIVDLVKRHKK